MRRAVDQHVEADDRVVRAIVTRERSAIGDLADAVADVDPDRVVLEIVGERDAQPLSPNRIVSAPFAPGLVKSWK